MLLTTPLRESRVYLTVAHLHIEREKKPTQVCVHISSLTVFAKNNVFLGASV